MDDANTTKHKCYIASPTGRIAIYTQTYDKHTFGTTYDTKYLHKDHLGSVDVITDSTGAVLERDSFDAWGFRRTTDWQAQRPIGSTSIVSRGFTDHEELDSLGLVNMNGRIYDPGLGRFVSADPFIQAPTVTQNFNRYSYVVNNPLSLSDPSGFNIFGNFFRWLNHALGPVGAQIAVAVVGIVAGVITGGLALGAYASYAGITFGMALGQAFGGGLTAAIIAGAGAGFGSAFTSTLLSGADIGQAFASGAIGGVAGALTAWAGATVLHPIPFEGPTSIAEKCFGHALLGGAFAAAQNGLQSGKAARDGFIGAFMAELFTGGMAPGGNFGEMALHAAAAGVIGGTAALITGGKFANGAISAAFLRLFNDEVQDAVGSVAQPEHFSDSRLFKALAEMREQVGSADLQGMTTTEFAKYMLKLNSDPLRDFYNNKYYSYDGYLSELNGVYHGHEINYYAIGMGFAARGLSIEKMYLAIYAWKDWQYVQYAFSLQWSRLPSAGIRGSELTWATLGYTYYERGGHL